MELLLLYYSWEVTGVDEVDREKASIHTQCIIQLKIETERRVRNISDTGSDATAISTPSLAGSSNNAVASTVARLEPSLYVVAAKVSPPPPQTNNYQNNNDTSTESTDPAPVLIPLPQPTTPNTPQAVSNQINTFPPGTDEERKR